MTSDENNKKEKSFNLQISIKNFGEEIDIDEEFLQSWTFVKYHICCVQCKNVVKKIYRMENSWKMQKCCFGKNIDPNWLYYYVRQAKVIIIINSCLLEYMNPSLINNYYAFNNGLIIIQN